MVDYFIFFTQKTKNFSWDSFEKYCEKKGAFLKYFKKIAYVGPDRGQKKSFPVVWAFQKKKTLTC